MRRTNIICTLGPSSSKPEEIQRLAEGGMSIARINFSHGSEEQHRTVVAAVQELNAKRKKTGIPPIGLILDTKGAEIRTGDTEKPIEIAAKEEIVFTSVAKSKSGKVIQVNYDGFAKDVRETDRILIDNGEIIFDIVRIEKNGDVLARAREGGKIGSRRHVNLPGADVDLPSITVEDWKDIQFGIEHDMDFLALSFIRNRDDVESVRAFLKSHKSTMEIIAKIETKQAVLNIQEIINAADAVMVARGDLGAELPFETLPVLQDEIVARCRGVGKPVIVATQMLESMIVQPTPTRAEVTDIAHAATTEADATMLSGETAAGKHPLLALQAMDRVLRATEEHLARFPHGSEPIQSERQARAEAAHTLALSSSADAIIAFTRTGQTARDLSKFRPRIPIFAFMDEESIARKLRLSYGVYPCLATLEDDPEKTVAAALAFCKKHDLLQKGDKVVIVSDTRAHEQLVNTVQLRMME